MRREPKLRARRPARPTYAQRGSDLWFAPVGIGAGIVLLALMHVIAPLVERHP